jgi:uncharacterized repeat protein (TIGR01451 family)
MNRKILVLSASLVLVSLLVFSGFGKTYNYTNLWGDPGYNLISSDAGGVEVVYSLEEFMIEDVDIKGQTMQAVILPGNILPNNPGAPNLPGLGRYIAIPEGATAKLTVLGYRSETIPGLDVMPAFPIPLDTDNSPLVLEKDPNIYNLNAFYPERPFKLSERTELRGVDVVVLGISPFQYNPVTRELVVYRDVRVRIDFAGGKGHFGDDALRGRFWEPILQNNLLNYSSLPVIDFDRRIRENTDETNVEYLIIIPDDPAFIAWADSIKNWRKLQGITTGVTRLSEIPGGNNATAIENYINNAYNTWTIRPEAVLLLSDYQNTGDDYGITSPVWNNYCVSDNIYADVTGDHLPEIAFSRIIAQNAVHLERIIGKILTYERTPSTDPNFYDQPLIAAGWQSDRWFVLCAEVCYGFFSNVLDKRPTRQYAGTTTPPTTWSTNPNTPIVVNYFGPNGLGYIPASPSYLTNWTGNAAGINAAINAGTFLVLHRDHGLETGWGTPSYTNTNLTGLTNTTYPFVFSINCLTGKYNWTSQCFSEAFSRMQYGAVGLVAASEVSYSFVNDTFCWGMWDSMWPNFDPGYGGNQMANGRELMTGFAQAAGKIYLAVSNWPYNPNNKVHTYNLFHHFGDGFFTLYTEVPQNLNVSHANVLFSGSNFFTVTANPGALIGLTVNGNIIGIGTGTGAPVNISITPQLPGQNMMVTITLANYFRYSQQVQIVPPGGAYCIYDNFTISDPTPAGNNNGQLDFNEDAYLTVGIKNVGTDTAFNISATIASTDPYVTIYDNSATYGTIAPNAVVSVTNGYQIGTDVDVPDGHIIPFSLTATDGDSTWVSSFSITAHAPVVEFDHITIADPTGNNNNQLDPGETANFTIYMKNNGTCFANNVIVDISTLQAGITIPTAIDTIESLTAGATATVIYNGVQAATTVPMGTNVDFDLGIIADNGYENEDTFTILVGDIRYQPCGPDGYGYWAYDMFDGPNAPAYSWVEIAPAAGGPGTAVTLGDDQTVGVTLPFTFRYYGNNFTNASLCSNGWLAMGSTTSTAYANYGIPNTQGPPNMIAGMWDDLYPPGGGQIAYYNDAVNHRYITEWRQIPHYGGAGGPETFEIILLDPAFYPTITGDGDIIVQYQTIANITSTTHGIENSPQTVGIQYLYNGAYHTNAMPITNSFAIKYTVGNQLPTGLQVVLTPAITPIVIPATGGSFQYTVDITNTGTSPAFFSAWTQVTLPAGTVFGPLVMKMGINLNPAGVITRTITQNVPASAPPGNYIHWACAGGYPSAIAAQDSFAFSKAGMVDGSMSLSDWTYEGWDEELQTMVTIPSEFFLEQNYPNPFNPETTFGYGLPEEANVTLTLYDLLGREVAVIFEGKQSAGYHSVKWNATGFASGVYFYRLEAGSNVAMKKCILMK